VNPPQIPVSLHVGIEFRGIVSAAGRSWALWCAVVPGYQRTPEIGMRMALGAERKRVLRLMLLDGLRPALVGLALGMAASVAITRLIRSVLYGTSPLDATVFILVILTLLLASTAACLVPAWRAARIDPMRALRSE